MTTQPSNVSDKREQMAQQARDTAQQAAQGARESTQRMAEQTRQAWQEAQENPTPSGIMGALEQLPATTYLYATIGSIGLSLLLRMFGRKDFANFVGLWAPTFISLGLMSKLVRPSREM